MDETITLEPHPECCPACGSPRVAYLLYGVPAHIFFLVPLIETGEMRIAGRDLAEDSQQWHCRACHHEWGRNPFADLLRSRRLKAYAAAEAAKEECAV